MRRDIAKAIRSHEQEARHLFHLNNLKQSPRQQPEPVQQQSLFGKKENIKDRILRIESKLEQRSILNKKSKRKQQQSSSHQKREESGFDNSMYESTQTFANTIQNRESIQGSRADEISYAETQNISQTTKDGEQGTRPILQNARVKSELVKGEEILIHQ